MKVSLITIKSRFNYGAALQCYATYKYLKKNKFDVEVVDYCPNIQEKKSLLRTLKAIAMELVTIRKRNKIKSFYNNSINMTNHCYKSFEELKKSPPIADIYMVGSDQVWNSQMSGGVIDPAYFLGFIESEKKISYASSIGRTDISQKDLIDMVKYLKNFSHIAVRENSAKEILENQGINGIVSVLDPVFLLNKEDYQKLITPVKYRKYLLIYGFEKSFLIENLAKEISNKLGLQIIELGTFRSRYSCDKYLQNVGVEDFLSLIYHADYILTSSFHGTAFSIMLNKQFISVAPSSRATRLENITTVFNIEGRLISEKDNYVINDLLQPIDYKQINEFVSLNSQTSRDFINNALLK